MPKIKSGKLNNLLACLEKHFTGQDPTRPQLGGVWVSSESGLLYLRATDGCVAVRLKANLPGHPDGRTWRKGAETRTPEHPKYPTEPGIDRVLAYSCSTQERAMPCIDGAFLTRLSALAKALGLSRGIWQVKPAGELDGVQFVLNGYDDVTVVIMPVRPSDAKAIIALDF
jgi:hypothetical protein